MTRKERLDAAALLASIAVGAFLGAFVTWWVGPTAFLTFLILDHWVNVSAGTYK